MTKDRIAGFPEDKASTPEPAYQMPACFSDRDISRQRANNAGHRAVRWLVVGFALVATSGCGLSTLTSGLSGGVFGGSSTTQSQGGPVSEEQLLSEAKTDASQSSGLGEVEHGCPRFSVWPRDNNVTIYEAGRTGDGLAVMHRGELTKTARECRIEQGRVTVKYGFSGRILLGPKGRNGVVTLPVTVFVTDAKRERLKSESMRIEAAVSIDKPIGYFSAVRTVTFNIPEGSRPGEFELYVGFERNIPGAG